MTASATVLWTRATIARTAAAVAVRSAVAVETTRASTAGTARRDIRSRRGRNDDRSTADDWRIGRRTEDRSRRADDWIAHSIARLTSRATEICSRAAVAVRAAAVAIWSAVAVEAARAGTTSTTRGNVGCRRRGNNNWSTANDARHTGCRSVQRSRGAHGGSRSRSHRSRRSREVDRTPAGILWTAEADNDLLAAITCCHSVELSSTIVEGAVFPANLQVSSVEKGADRAESHVESKGHRLNTWVCRDPSAGRGLQSTVDNAVLNGLAGVCGSVSSGSQVCCTGCLSLLAVARRLNGDDEWCAGVQGSVRQGRGRRRWSSGGRAIDWWRDWSRRSVDWRNRR